MYDNILSVKAPFIMDLFSMVEEVVEIYSQRIDNISQNSLDEKIKNEVLRIAGIFKLPIVDYGKEEILLECMQTETRNDEMIAYFSQYFKNIEVVRGGSVAIQGVSIQDK